MLEQVSVSIFGVDERRARKPVGFCIFGSLAIIDKSGRPFDLDVCVTFYGER
jgi:hypothetical protein